MKYPKNAINYWDEGQKQRRTTKHTQLAKRLGLYRWYKKGFWKRYFRKKINKDFDIGE